MQANCGSLWNQADCFWGMPIDSYPVRSMIMTQNQALFRCFDARRTGLNGRSCRRLALGSDFSIDDLRQTRKRAIGCREMVFDSTAQLQWLGLGKAGHLFSESMTCQRQLTEPGVNLRSIMQRPWASARPWFMAGNRAFDFQTQAGFAPRILDRPILKIPPTRLPRHRQ
jgi:hypothetical protein